MGKVIAVLNQKGGVAKSSVSTNLGRALVLDGHKVLLVDSDPQGSARDWSGMSAGEILTVVGLDRPTLDKDILKFKDGFDYLIIDGSPSIEAMSVAAIKCADVILIPVQPSPYDLWACKDLVDLIKARQSVTDGNPKAAFLITRTIKNSRLSKEIGDALSDYDLPVFNAGTAQRVVYAESAASGLTVLDVQGADDAKKEMLAIKDELLEFMK